MYSRQQVEDIIQQITCKLLPRIDPKNIRPAYQDFDNMGKDILRDDLEHTYSGFTPQDNFIYITVNFGTAAVLTSVDSSGNVHTGYSASATFTLYGNQSSELSVVLLSLLKIPDCVQAFEQSGIFISSYAQQIDELHEIINEQWFERHEFRLELMIPSTIKSPLYPNEATLDSVSTSIKITALDNQILVSSGGSDVEK